MAERSYITTVPASHRSVHAQRRDLWGEGVINRNVPKQNRGNDCILNIQRCRKNPHDPPKIYYCKMPRGRGCHLRPVHRAPLIRSL
ncbi:hypothetical protein GDO81_018341 [Engystomops pustulosus]|uniref:Uncharacterized protein n=1 Tax=Engystomops pustulosus TaxID=76066 RepID=A0AAV7AAJ5_ENGPU|nr:hypothetical protein GDO81_018341 [Engystomops pustulosus]